VRVGRADRQSGAGRLLLGLLFGVSRVLVAEGADYGVALVVGEPELTGLGMEVEAHRVAKGPPSNSLI